MKNSFQIIAAAVLASCLAGCSENPGVETPAERLIHTTVSIAGTPGTKATDVTSNDEEAISNLQIFVFDDKGAVEDYIDAGASRTGEVITKEGEKTVVAIVNAPSLRSVTTRSGLFTKTTLLADNHPGSMVMTGEATAVLQDGGNLTIPVTRIISKVVLKKVTLDFTSTINAGKEFRIQSIYLINVPGDNTYSAASEPTIWYNKLRDGYNDTGCESFRLLSDSVNTTVGNKSSYSRDHSFYCYPNPVSAESFDSTWSPRHTMLVVDALLGNDKVYYPVELPVIGRNKCLTIEELTITKKGSDQPYKPVEDGTCNITVSIVPWDVTFYRETI